MAGAAEDALLETCCVCLDSLSSAPVTVLLSSTRAPSLTRACPHYIHLSCAELLHPAKCPLCRTDFVALSEAIDRCTLSALPPGELLAGVQRLNGAPLAKPPSAPRRAVVELLLATWPVPKATLLEDIERLGIEAPPGEICENSLVQLMHHFGIQPAPAVVCGSLGVPMPGLQRVGYTLATRLLRRFNWALLKVTGAVGASLFCGTCGMGFGVLAGGVFAIPRNQLPDHVQGEGLALVLQVAWLVCLAAYHGWHQPGLVRTWLSLGTGFGLLFGCFHGLVHVDPERHGLLSVFWTGISGQATLGALLGCHLGGPSGRPRPVRVNIFAPPTPT